ncbi:hypothetical protein CYMTET_55241 [Cymbomonas tetramitiformis]|uniref:Uncharacterized protein n=1 Tax=Cymbomonas tetramitiformis TaxID=36881 RepID=A0AAE0BDZ6_9CHLO|nr:hypothetical protein CYMTET_55241 [Cymbomonas tetramitiformis]|eukprot:gene3503-4403_t
MSVLQACESVRALHLDAGEMMAPKRPRDDDSIEQALDEAILNIQNRAEVMDSRPTAMVIDERVPLVASETELLENGFEIVGEQDLDQREAAKLEIAERTGELIVLEEDSPPVSPAGVAPRSADDDAWSGFECWFLVDDRACTFSEGLRLAAQRRTELLRVLGARAQLYTLSLYYVRMLYDQPCEVPTIALSDVRYRMHWIVKANSSETCTPGDMIADVRIGFLSDVARNFVMGPCITQTYGKRHNDIMPASVRNMEKIVHVQTNRMTRAKATELREWLQSNAMRLPFIGNMMKHSDVHDILAYRHRLVFYTDKDKRELLCEVFQRLANFGIDSREPPCVSFPLNPQRARRILIAVSKSVSTSYKISSGVAARTAERMMGEGIPIHMFRYMRCVSTRAYQHVMCFCQLPSPKVESKVAEHLQSSDYHTFGFYEYLPQGPHPDDSMHSGSKLPSEAGKREFVFVYMSKYVNEQVKTELFDILSRRAARPMLLDRQHSQTPFRVWLMWRTSDTARIYDLSNDATLQYHQQVMHVNFEVALAEYPKMLQTPSLVELVDSRRE